jgi:hypothetical protein
VLVCHYFIFVAYGHGDITTIAIGFSIKELEAPILYQFNHDLACCICINFGGVLGNLRSISPEWHKWEPELYSLPLEIEERECEFED